MSNEELNRRISELREPKPPRYLGVPQFVSKIKRSELDAWRCTWTPPAYGAQDGDWEPRDWTGSEDASAVLRDELPHPTIFKALNHSDGNWIVHPVGLAGERYPEGGHADYKTAIALAWLAWRESEGGSKMKLACGCETRFEFRSNSWDAAAEEVIGVAVEFCPTHKAAPKMLEALRQRRHGRLPNPRPDLNGEWRRFDRDVCDWSNDCRPGNCAWLDAQAISLAEPVQPKEAQ